MQTKHYIVGSAGHIDHGKSTLIEALSGTNPDRLPEELARGMTIDLGFAHLTLQGGDEVFDLGLIDVPGHADFVNNMVAGVGAVDLALFVVAADDGWMPQSEEHLQILDYLGVRRAVVALTKADTVEDPAERVAEIELALEGSGFEGAPVVPVCAISGEGLDELKAALLAALSDLPEPADIGKPCLSVDRVFSPQGVGTVVTGTLAGGSLKKGHKVLVQPAGIHGSLRNIQNHSSNVEEAHPGMRTALNIPDVPIASRIERNGIRRGSIVTIDGLGQAARRLHVALQRSERTIQNQSATQRPIKHGHRVRWHHGSASVSARVFFLENRDLKPGETAFAELRLDAPVFALDGDRFVLRDWSKRTTLAGGMVLDSSPPARSYRIEAQTTLLKERLAAPADPAVWLQTLVRREQAINDPTPLSQSHFSGDEIAAAIAVNLTIERIGPWLVDAEWWQEMVDRAESKVNGFLKANPEKPGLELNELRAFVLKKLPHEKLFEPFLDWLCSHGFLRVGTAIRSGSHRPELPPNLAGAGDRIRKALAANPLEPPNPKELAPTPDDQKALQFLINNGEAVHLSDKAVLSMDSYNGAIARIRAHIESAGPSTAADIRTVLGTTRRILIPLLEKLDSSGVTVRQGDLRILRK